MVDHTKAAIQADTIAEMDRQIKQMQEALLIIEGLSSHGDLSNDPNLASIYKIAHISHGKSYCAYIKGTTTYKNEGCGLWSEEIPQLKQALKDSMIIDVEEVMHKTHKTSQIDWIV